MTENKKTEFVNIGDVLLKYSRYWKWFLLSLAITVCLAVFYMKTVDPVYYIASYIKIRTEEEGSKVASSLVKSFGLGGVAGTENIDDQAAIISSHSHMRDMIYDLRLAVSYDLKKFPFDKSLYNTSPVVIEAEKNLLDTLSYFVRFYIKVNKDRSAEIEAKYKRDLIGEYKGVLPAKVQTDYGIFLVKYSDKTIEQQSYRIEADVSGLDYAAETFRKQIGVGAIDNKSDIITLNIKDTERQRGKDILNKLVELYNRDTKSEKNEEAKNTASFIKERIDLLSEELSLIERKLENFKKQNQMLNLDLESKAIISRTQELQEKTTSINIQQNLVAMLNNYISDSQNKYKPIPANTGVSGSTADAIGAYNSVIMERIRLLQHSTENNPAVRLLDEQIETLRKNVQESIKGLQKDIAVHRKDWSGLETDVQERMSQIPTQEREYIELQRQRSVKAELYVFLLTKMEETQLMLASTTPKAQVMDSAYSATKPVAPKLKVVLGLALILGIMLPIIIIYILDIFKTKIQTKAELEGITRLPVLGEICLDKNSGNVAVAEGVSTSTAELFRLVRTNLQFLLKKNEKVILVTSSVSGEGKSFFTVNLAISFSLIKNKKVVLVGLDIRNPKLSEYLSIKRRDGITMYLASDDMKPDDVIISRPDLHPNIYIVPAGPIPPNPSELLLGDRLEEFFTYLRANFDYIIVDTAPVGMVSDTFSLDRISDATIYLFRANYTNKSHLKFAEAIVEDKKLKKMSVVINGTTTKAAYGYGYNNSTTNQK